MTDPAPKPQRSPARSTIWTPPVIALVVINSVLAMVLVAVLVLNSQRSNDQPVIGATDLAAREETPSVESQSSEPQDQQPQPSEPAETTASSPAVTTLNFALPSQNIWCSLDEEAVCTIAEVADPSQWRDCNLPGYQVRLLADGDSALACPNEEQPTTAPSSYQQMAYGSQVSNERYTCDISESGVLCRSDETGRGFSLNRSGWQER